MVNVGGRSKGCRTCISRKIRCDRQRPTCGQCQKSKRECGGYRDANELVFRDQTSSVLAKVQKAPGQQASILQTNRSSVRGASQPPRLKDISRTAPATPPDGTALSQSPRLDEVNGLTTFFTNNFTSSELNGQPMNLFHVPRNFDDLLKGRAVDASMQAAACMALSRLRRSPYFYRQAQRHYGTALASMNSLLRQDGLRASEGPTLTVAFLAFFEILASAGDSQSSRRAWMSHIRGISALLNKDGTQNMSPTFASRMLVMSRGQAILNALQTKTRLPETYMRATNEIRDKIPPRSSHNEDVDTMIVRLTTLQADFHEYGPSTILLSDLKALETALDLWPTIVPPSWSFSAQPNLQPHLWWWEARYDVYPNDVVAHAWNRHRTAAIMVHDLVQQVALGLLVNDPDDMNALAQVDKAAEVGSTSQKIRGLTVDICATLPAAFRPLAASHGAHEDMPRLGIIFWLLWPLEVVGTMREAPVQLTRWLRDRFDQIYESTGIVKAKLSAERLEAARPEIL